MTDRLYYDDSYATSFEATVLECREGGGKILLRLDRSAFYPTSGGQPYDTGSIGGAAVLDVFVDDAGEVWHQVDRALPEGEAVAGRIDWARRFDHMQQHAGEHMLAGAIHRRLNGHVIGLHLGAEVSTIDVELPGGEMRVPDAVLRALEIEVNEQIQRDVPIAATFPEAEALSRMPLRKPPAVDEHIRVVGIGDFEYCACGGTHPSTSGQVGLLKITDARPSKGKMRVSFLCGMRAYRDYQRQADAAFAAAEQLSTGVERLPEAVALLREKLRAAEREAALLRREKLLSEVPAMLAAAAATGAAKLVARTVEADAALLRDLASKLIEGGGIIALLAAPQGEGNLFVFARSADVEADMGALLSRSARKGGGKGGGKPDFAQGGGPAAVFEAAQKELMGDGHAI